MKPTKYQKLVVNLIVIRHMQGGKDYFESIKEANDFVEK